MLILTRDPRDGTSARVFRFLQAVPQPLDNAPGCFREGHVISAIRDHGSVK